MTIDFNSDEFKYFTKDRKYSKEEKEHLEELRAANKNSDDIHSIFKSHAEDWMYQATFVEEGDTRETFNDRLSDSLFDKLTSEIPVDALFTVLDKDGDETISEDEYEAYKKLDNTTDQDYFDFWNLAYIALDEAQNVSGSTENGTDNPVENNGSGGKVEGTGDTSGASGADGNADVPKTDSDDPKIDAAQEPKKDDDKTPSKEISGAPKGSAIIDNGDGTYSVKVDKWNSSAHGDDKYANDCLSHILDNSYPGLSWAEKEKVFAEMQKLNPQIKDVNVIHTGDTLQIPSLKFDADGKFTGEFYTAEEMKAAQAAENTPEKKVTEEVLNDGQILYTTTQDDKVIGTIQYNPETKTAVGIGSEKDDKGDKFTVKTEYASFNPETGENTIASKTFYSQDYEAGKSLDSDKLSKTEYYTHNADGTVTVTARDAEGKLIGTTRIAAAQVNEPETPSPENTPGTEPQVVKTIEGEGFNMVEAVTTTDSNGVATTVRTSMNTGNIIGTEVKSTDANGVTTVINSDKDGNETSRLIVNPDGTATYSYASTVYSNGKSTPKTTVVELTDMNADKSVSDGKQTSYKTYNQAYTSDLSQLNANNLTVESKISYDSNGKKTELVKTEFDHDTNTQTITTTTYGADGKETGTDVKTCDMKGNELAPEDTPSAKEAYQNGVNKSTEINKSLDTLRAAQSENMTDTQKTEAYHTLLTEMEEQLKGASSDEVQGVISQISDENFKVLAEVLKGGDGWFKDVGDKHQELISQLLTPDLNYPENITRMVNMFESSETGKYGKETYYNNFMTVLSETENLASLSGDKAKAVAEFIGKGYDDFANTAGMQPMIRQFLVQTDENYNVKTDADGLYNSLANMETLMANIPENYKWSVQSNLNLYKQELVNALNKEDFASIIKKEGSTDKALKFLAENLGVYNENMKADDLKEALHNYMPNYDQLYLALAEVNTGSAAAAGDAALGAQLSNQISIMKDYNGNDKADFYNERLTEMAEQLKNASAADIQKAISAMTQEDITALAKVLDFDYGGFIGIGKKTVGEQHKDLVAKLFTPDLNNPENIEKMIQGLDAGGMGNYGTKAYYDNMMNLLNDTDNLAGLTGKQADAVAKFIGSAYDDYSHSAGMDPIIRRFTTPLDEDGSAKADTDSMLNSFANMDKVLANIPENYEWHVQENIRFSQHEQIASLSKSDFLSLIKKKGSPEAAKAFLAEKYGCSVNDLGNYMPNYSQLFLAIKELDEG